MAEVRCPKCDKPNPSDADVCRHCRQRLQPENPSTSQPSASNEPDWLRELRSEGSSSSSNEQEQSPDSQIPDWLTRIRQRGQEDQGGLEDLFGKSEPSSNSAHDWLESKPEETSAIPAGADWLSELRSPDAAQTTPEEPQPTGDDAWLSGLQDWKPSAEDSSASSTQADEEPLQPVQESSPDLSAWLNNLDSQGEKPVVPETPWDPQTGLTEPTSEGGTAPDLPSWLQMPGAIEDQQQTTDQSLVQEPGKETPAKESVGFTGWLRNLETPPTQQPSEPVAAGSDEMPSWLADMQNIAPSADEPVPSIPAAEPTPSWLSGLEVTAAAAAEPEPSTTASSTEPLPSWLKDSPEPPAAVSLPVRAPTEELPSWMAGFSAEEPVTVAPQPTQAAAEELPSWMAGFASDLETPDQPSAQAEELPAWMNQAQETEYAEGQPPVPVEEAPSQLGVFGEAEGAVVEAEIAPVESAAPEPEPAGDDWLQTFGQIREQPPVQVEPAANFGVPGWQATTRDATKETPSRPFIEENIPAWLNSVDQQITAETPVGSPALIDEPETQDASLDQGAPFQVDLPDWIGEEPAQYPSEAARPGEEEPQEELAQAELPSWVKDMRPIESAIAGELMSDTDQRIEKSGPLAGLRGILPGEDLAVRYRKLPVYSVKLKVSERQRQYINLLENVIALESQPQAVPSTPSQAPQFILRFVIGLVLVVALLLPPLFNIQITPLPSIPPAGLLEMYNLVEALPTDAPVLLAVDYEPALAGEMQLASSAVIEHLMVKNARIAVISTVPSGPIMAEQLISSVQIRQPGYDLKNQKVNLSYLAGGTTSLLEFANRPQQAAPIALDSAITGELPWQLPALQGIQNLQDFALVIVLTDSSENGRAWVEQVQPMLGQTPLTMVTSAQAAPMLLPYLDSQQVRGLVSGLYGGAMYEKRSGRISLTPGYYMGYQGAFLVGILVLFLGGTLSLALSMTRRSKKGKA